MKRFIKIGLIGLAMLGLTGCNMDITEKTVISSMDTYGNKRQTVIIRHCDDEVVEKYETEWRKD